LLLFAASAQPTYAQPKATTRWQGQIFVLLVPGDSLGTLVWKLDSAAVLAWLDSSITVVAGATADRVGATGYTASILPHNAADTSGNKHVLLWTALDRELPLAHGTTYSALTANVFIRWGVTPYTVHTYSTTWTTVGSGATALTAGDRIVARFYPQVGLLTDKLLKLYRIPAGTAPYNVMFGEQIGLLTIPVAKFPTHVGDAVNITITITYKVQ